MCYHVSNQRSFLNKPTYTNMIFKARAYLQCAKCERYLGHDDYWWEDKQSNDKVCEDCFKKIPVTERQVVIKA